MIYNMTARNGRKRQTLRFIINADNEIEAIVKAKDTLKNRVDLKGYINPVIVEL